VADRRPFGQLDRVDLALRATALHVDGHHLPANGRRASVVGLRRGLNSVGDRRPTSRKTVPGQQQLLRNRSI
jgi:hypothetical protein